MPKILLTGGGTAGHVTPNIALIPELRKKGFEINYIGTADGLERKLIEDIGVKYYPISAGKLRRYLDIKNFIDTGRIAKGFFQAMKLMRKIKPDVVFSKGGFVSTPVVWAAYLNKIPVIIHESDMTPGLANKLSIPFTNKICHAFPETAKYIDRNKACFTGIPIRQELLSGNADTGRELCGFSSQKPVLLVVGGSQGSKFINDAIRNDLKRLMNEFQICHICGKGGVDDSLKNIKGYRQYEYVTEELPHLFAMADVVVTRAGATTIFELLALKKPNLLIPLSKKASRGDQILNAESFRKQGFSSVLQEEEFTEETLFNTLMELYKNRSRYIGSMKKSEAGDGITKVMDLIAQFI